MKAISTSLIFIFNLIQKFRKKTSDYKNNLLFLFFRIKKFRIMIPKQQKRK